MQNVSCLILFCEVPLHANISLSVRYQHGVFRSVVSFSPDPGDISSETNEKGGKADEFISSIDCTVLSSPGGVPQD